MANPGQPAAAVNHPPQQQHRHNNHPPPPFHLPKRTHQNPFVVPNNAASVTNNLTSNFSGLQQQTNEADKNKVNCIGGASTGKPYSAEAVNNHPAGLQNSKLLTGCSKSKVSKYTKSEPQEPNDDHADKTQVATGCRYDNSLGLLTKKFLFLIQNAKDGVLDLNKTAEMLDVKKRRIYDITNVLEGIGLTEKIAKNHIRWKGFDMMGPRELNYQAAQLQAELDSLEAEDYRLEERIRETQERIRAMHCDGNSKKHLFVTEKDIMSLPHFKDKTVIVVKAPRGTVLEAPDPDEVSNDPVFAYPEREFRLKIRSVTGPVNLYLISKREEQCNNITMKSTNSMDWSNGDGYTLTENTNSMDWSDANGERYQDANGLSSNHQTNQEGAHANSIRSEDSKVYELQKIVPEDGHVDDDYWLRSDCDVSTTELWGRRHS